MTKVDKVLNEVAETIKEGERMADLARFLGKSWSQCSEWIKDRKYQPSAEVILRMIEWCAIKNPSSYGEAKIEDMEKVYLNGKELNQLEKELYLENWALKKIIQNS